MNRGLTLIHARRLRRSGGVGSVVSTGAQPIWGSYDAEGNFIPPPAGSNDPVLSTQPLQDAYDQYAGANQEGVAWWTNPWWALQAQPGYSIPASSPAAPAPTPTLAPAAPAPAPTFSNPFTGAVETLSPVQQEVLNARGIYQDYAEQERIAAEAERLAANAGMNADCQVVLAPAEGPGGQAVYSTECSVAGSSDRHSGASIVRPGGVNILRTELNGQQARTAAAASSARPAATTAFNPTGNVALPGSTPAATAVDSEPSLGAPLVEAAENILDQVKTIPWYLWAGAAGATGLYLYNRRGSRR